MNVAGTDDELADETASVKHARLAADDDACAPAAELEPPCLGASWGH